VSSPSVFHRQIQALVLLAKAVEGFLRRLQLGFQFGQLLVQKAQAFLRLGRAALDILT